MTKRDNMRVLVRGDEIITEPFDQWTLDHLDWLTTPRPDGDGYELIDVDLIAEQAAEQLPVERVHRLDDWPW